MLAHTPLPNPALHIKQEREMIYRIGIFLVSVILALIVILLLISRPSFFTRGTSTRLVEVANLKTHVETLSLDLSPRDFENVENLNNVADYITSEFMSYGYAPKVQLFTVNSVEYKNVIVNIGTEIKRPKIIIGAHYDAAGPFPGADDNASGVAGILELARILKGRRVYSPITIVAYSLEEPPFFGSESMGSFIHAKSEKEQSADIELMISLEMLGYYSEEENSQNYPLGFLKLIYPSKADFIAIVDQLFSNSAYKLKKALSKNMSLEVYSINAPSIVPGIDFSDHRNYWLHGFNAVMITDTAFLRYPYYHTDNDTIDKLNFDKMAEVVNGLIGYLSTQN